MKAIMMKNTPEPIMTEKYMIDCREGTKLVAEETLPGSSRTPFVTLTTCPHHHCCALQTLYILSNLELKGLSRQRIRDFEHLLVCGRLSSNVK